MLEFLKTRVVGGRAHSAPCLLGHRAKALQGHGALCWALPFRLADTNLPACLESEEGVPCFQVPRIWCNLSLDPPTSEHFWGWVGLRASILCPSDDFYSSEGSTLGKPIWDPHSSLLHPWTVLGMDTKGLGLVRGPKWSSCWRAFCLAREESSQECTGSTGSCPALLLADAHSQAQPCPLSGQLGVGKCVAWSVGGAFQ